MAPREDSASKSQLTRSPKDAQALNGDGNHSNETNDKEEEQQTQTKSDWRAFLRQPLSVALVAILAGLMILYIDPPWLSSLDMRSRIPPPHYWLLDTTTAYHITPNRSDFCAYHSLAPRLHSSLLPPLTLSTPDDPSYEDDGADSSSYDPFTLYHLGHRVLGYGTVRLAVPWPADSNYSLAPPAHTFSKLNYTILTNVLYIPTAQEPSISVARLVTDSSNLVRIVTGASNGNDVTEKALELVIFSSDGALSFMKPDKTRIRNGRYLVRAWAWKNWNCEDNDPNEGSAVQDNPKEGSAVQDDPKGASPGQGNPNEGPPGYAPGWGRDSASRILVRKLFGWPAYIGL